MQKALSHFSNLYQLSKTLRFELIPQGKTLEYIQQHGLLEQDEKRAASYEKVKKIIDEYHKQFISRALNNFRIEGLNFYLELYNKAIRTDVEKKEIEDLAADFRKQIAERFSKHPDDSIKEKFKNLFSKELIKIDLKEFVPIEDKNLVEEFDNFTTYFTGFHENRRNMYSAEDKSTAIAFRLIHQNLPFFIDNLKTFEKIKETIVSEHFEKIVKEQETILQVKDLDEVFTIEYFNETLTQKGIDVYNTLLGGIANEDGKKIQGLNEHINLYNQTQTDRNKRLGKLKPLYKQILSDRSTASYLPEMFKDDNEVLEAIEQFYQNLHPKISNEEKDSMGLLQIILHLREYDISKIYIKNDLSLTDISQKMFGEWGMLHKTLEKWYELNQSDGKGNTSKKFEDGKNKFVKKSDSFSIGFLNECISLHESDRKFKVEDYFKAFGKIEDTGITTKSLYEQFNENYLLCKDLLNQPYATDKKLGQDKKNLEKIKSLLDSIKAIQHFLKPLNGNGDEADKDSKFYGDFKPLYDELDQINLLYNKVRNYATQRLYSTEKIKLNFQNSTLLDGWDLNKESDNTSVIFKKAGNYFLGIMNKKNNKVFKKVFENVGNDFYEKMVYKLLPGANKMLPKVFFANSRIDEFAPSKEIIENYKNETHKKGDSFNIHDCHSLIDFFKSSINMHEDWKHFNFKFSDTKTYEDLSGFYREVEQQGYKISFQQIPTDYIEQLVEEGKLYLFQIYNKDFSPYSKGTPNLHTLYWKMLFDETNLKNACYKLNGQAEVFFRKSSIKEDNKIVHKKETSIENKNPLNEKRQSKFDYDIIKDRRYTIDKFQFHVPVTMNFKAKGLSNINLEINQFLKHNTNIHIIGIDRGERHLLYLTMINQRGEIVKQFSLNEIVNEYQGRTYKTNYHTLLDKKEGNRDEARKNWGTIETIKELKEGYLSQVIHKIAELMVEYNAIVVLEDLNIGFMRGRQKVEKQVYQKFEKMLIDKLNYYVDKKKETDESGGILNALQLTNKFESFKKLGKQSGFLFYVPAWNTSKMDPTTGFVNMLNPKFENIEKAKSFITKFDNIHFNCDKQWFEFTFDYKNFTAKAEGSQTQWTMIANNEKRYSYNKSINNGKGGQEEYCICERLEELLGKNNIVYGGGENLITQLVEQKSADFFKTLIKLISVTTVLRHNNGLKADKEEDYILSPILNKKGDFFDSRKAGNTLPKDADANGAYHIAKKGLWVLQQINETEDLKKLKIAISNKEWLEFAQKNK